MGNLKIKMKFALYTALIALASAKTCNDLLKANLLKAKFYLDASCKTEDVVKTKTEGKVPEEWKPFFDGECHDKGSASYKFTCDDTKYTAEMWTKVGCKDKAKQV